MANLSFSVALNLLTDNFKKGANTAKAGLREIQMQAMAMVAAFGAGSLGLGEFVSNLIETARTTSRTSTALKNVSGDVETYAKNQKFLIGLSQKYGLYVNDLVGNYSKFTAAASNANMSMKDQQLIFESLSRASTGFGLSADETNGVFLAVTQMMGKGKIQAEELRGQLGERMPIAMQAMARAAGTSVAGLDKIMKAGKLMSADVLPKFAKALNEMMPNVNTDNVETSFNRLKNKFKELTDALNVGGIYKGLLDQTNSAFSWVLSNLKSVGQAFVNIISTIIIVKGFKMIISAYTDLTKAAQISYMKQARVAGESFDKAAFAANKFSMTMKFALKSAFSAFAPMVIISGIIAIVQHFESVAEKARELRAIWTDFQNGFKNAAKNDSQVRELTTLQNIISDTTKSLDDRKTALEQINTILGTNYKYEKNGLTINGDINTKIRERLGLLEKQAELSYLVNAKMQAGDKLNESNNKVTDDERNYNAWSSKAANKDKKGFIQIADESWQAKVWKEKLDNDTKENKALQTVYNSASNKIISLTNDIEKISGKQKGYVTPPDAPEKTKKTELEKTEQEYKDRLKELANTLANNPESLKENNKLVDELNKKTKEKLDGLLNPEQAANNLTYKLVKAGVLNPKTTGQDKVNDIETSYLDSKKDLDIELQQGYLDQKEYNTALSSLIKSTVKSVFKIDGIDVAATTFVKGIIEKNKELEKVDFKKFELPTRKNIDTTFDYKKTNLDKTQAKYDNTVDYKDALIDSFKNSTGDGTIEEQIKKANGDLTGLYTKFGVGLVEAINQLDEAIKNTGNLSDQLKLEEVKKDIKDLQKEFNNGLYDGIKNVAGSAKNMYEGVKAVSDTLSNVDASGFEKFLAIWDFLTSTVDGIMSVVKMIENLTTVTTALGVAKQAQAGIEAGISAGKIATNVAETASFTGLMAAETAAAYAYMPFVGQGLALAQIGVLQGAIIAAAIPKFANGGVVQGSGIGDTVHAMVAPNEMILNQPQQSNLFALLNGKGLNNGSNSNQPIILDIDWKLKGKELVAVINNENKIKSKVTK
jgi:tape measure domain-containing protein